ncbi:MAG: HAMP domain-containing histidine kinase [Pirellula sp.]|jgi:signal transduction histidine kinase|nr:HAMP domain-containing histidine kinase [Pirellula sp.]
MTAEESKEYQARLIRWAPAVSICFALLFVAMVSWWGVRAEWQHRRDSVYAAAINEARSHAERTGARIEMELDEGKKLSDFRQETLPRWLLRHWQQAAEGRVGRLYSAVTDGEQRILSHSDDLSSPNTSVGDNAFLDKNWQRTPLPHYGAGVHRITDAVLTRNADAIDITIPFQQAGHVVGYYHSGLDRNWLEQQVAAAQRDVIRDWAGIIAAIGLIVLLSSISLYRLGVHTIQLEQALGHAEAKRLADLSRLIVGMAHELRNPLNAVRLNLFTSEKLIRGESPMDPQDAVEMLRESVSEVQRVEDLVEQLLGYARLDTQEQPWIDVKDEIDGTLHFLKQVHEYHRIDIEVSEGLPGLQIRIDRKKFRQIMLNLLQNARQAMPEGGKLRIKVSRVEEYAVLEVEDSGNGISIDQYERIFEPFYSTRHEGVGLGLAVVKSLVENAGGRVSCERGVDLGGMNFRVTFPSRVAIREPLKTGSARSREQELVEQDERNTVHSGR